MDMMMAAVMREIGKISMEKVPMPSPQEGEVLIKTKGVGVCGSDLHYLEFGRIGSYVVEKPIILGHECAGEIVQSGAGVSNLKIGDLVALEPGIPCGKCHFCKTGRYNLCREVRFMATPPYDGAFAEYIAYPANMVFKLPKTMDAIEGALLEPLAVGFHAAHQAGAGVGKSAMILGAGCIGLVTMLALQAMGVQDIYIADVLGKRLEKAGQLGAKKTYKADECDVVAEMMQVTNKQGVDLVFETAGNRVTTQQSVDLVGRGGTIVLVGHAPDLQIPYDFNQLIVNEVTIKTVFRYKNLFPIAIKAVAEGMVPIKDIVTEIYSFNEVEKALLHNVHHKEDVVKTVIRF